MDRRPGLSHKAGVGDRGRLGLHGTTQLRVSRGPPRFGRHDQSAGPPNGPRIQGHPDCSNPHANNNAGRLAFVTRPPSQIRAPVQPSWTVRQVATHEFHNANPREQSHPWLGESFSLMLTKIIEAPSISARINGQTSIFRSLAIRSNDSPGRPSLRNIRHHARSLVDPRSEANPDSVTPKPEPAGIGVVDRMQ